MRKAISKKQRSNVGRKISTFSLHFIFSKVGLLSIASLLLLWSVYYACVQNVPQRFGAYIHQTMMRTTQSMGLVLREVFVFGRYRTTQEDTLNALRVEAGDPLLGYDLNAMQQRLQNLEWVKQATVRRALTGGLYIYLVERTPIAVYSDMKKKSCCLVDQDGSLIRQPVAPCFRGLPIVSGEQAPLHAPAMLKKIAMFPAVRSKLSAMVLIDERRWNLKISNALEVRLPEKQVKKALTILDTLMRNGKAMTGDILSIDLRIDGKVILKLSEVGKTFFKNYRSGAKA